MDGRFLGIITDIMEDTKYAPYVTKEGIGSNVFSYDNKGLLGKGERIRHWSYFIYDNVSVDLEIGETISSVSEGKECRFYCSYRDFIDAVNGIKGDDGTFPENITLSIGFTGSEGIYRIRLKSSEKESGDIKCSCVESGLPKTPEKCYESPTKVTVDSVSFSEWLCKRTEKTEDADGRCRYIIFGPVGAFVFMKRRDLMYKWDLVEGSDRAFTATNSIFLRSAAHIFTDVSDFVDTFVLEFGTDIPITVQTETDAFFFRYILANCDRKSLFKEFGTSDKKERKSGRKEKKLSYFNLVKKI